MEISSQYSSFAFKERSYIQTLDVLMAAVLKEQKVSNFEAIAFRGSSGASLAWPLVVHTGIPLIHSRKPGSHCSQAIEGAMGAKRYAIVDDLVETGETIREIADSITLGYSKWGYSQPILTDVFLVKQFEFDPDDYVPRTVNKQVGYPVRVHGLYKEIFDYVY